MISYKIIGDHIKEARLRKRLTQAEAADMLGISPTYYSKIERAAIRPNIEKLAEVSELFNIPFESLFQGAYISKEASMDNVPAEEEEFCAFFQEIDSLTDPQTKRLMMRICGDIMNWGRNRDNSVDI